MSSFWNWVPSILNAGVALWGADQQADAQNQATQQLAQSNTEATETRLDQINAAERIMLNQQQVASPGLIASLDVIGRGSDLTPEQERAVSDARGTTLNALRGSGLRGSTKATTAAIDDVEGRMTDRFIQSNQDRIDNVAGGVTGQYFNAGNNVANLNLQAGDTVSQGLISGGNIQASNTVGQANLAGTAIGDITAIIADQVKQNNNEKRDSSYDRPTGGA